LFKFETNYKKLPVLTKIPTWLQVYNRHIYWKVEGNEKNVYLSFDDGPHPTVTPLVLDLLQKHEVKANFFCVGQQVEQHPQIYQRILNEGHVVGNHSYSHPNGWKLSAGDYIEDVDRASHLIHSPLFRPPYGRLTPLQFKLLRKKYRIVMWDILTMDYDASVSDERVIWNATRQTSPGSILVMHDHEKTVNRMQRILPPILSGLKSQGWQFKLLVP
jgi:peptidoglycan/xylan/chitin deacetylase (PgdA/CDA1 family)